MAEEFGSAFLDLRKDATNNEKLVEFVRNHYVSRLGAPEFCSPLQRRLNPTNKLIHEQPANDPPFIVHDFFLDLSCLYREHSTMEDTLKSVGASFDKQLRCVAIFNRVSAVFFIAAAMICAAVAATVAAGAIPRRTGAAAAAAAASILFGAIGKWCHSVLNRRETAIRKKKEITALMIIGARFGMKDLSSIHAVARRLQFETESLSETGDDGERAAAVKKSFQELRRKVEDYSVEMKWVKQLVLESIIKHFG